MTRSRPSGTVNSPGPPASKLYSILAFCSGAGDEPLGVLPGNSLIYAAGGGAMIRFLRAGADAGAAVLVGRVACGTSGGVSSADDIELVVGRCPLAAYPDLAEATVSERLRAGSSATCSGGPVGFSSAFAAS